MDIDNPITEKSSSYVRNSEHLLKLIQGAPIHSNQMVILFTIVPTDDILTVVRNRLESDHYLEIRTNITIDNLIEMLTLCVQIISFQLESDIY